jgi:hypothetical protein
MRKRLLHLSISTFVESFAFRKTFPIPMRFKKFNIYVYSGLSRLSRTRALPLRRLQQIFEPRDRLSIDDMNYKQDVLLIV